MEYFAACFIVFLVIFWNDMFCRHDYKLTKENYNYICTKCGKEKFR